MRRFSPRWIIVAVALLAVGCANQKGPAEAAVANIESAVAAIKDEAAKYAPGDLVQHPNFGLGIATALKDNKIEVLFEEGAKVLAYQN